MEAWKRGSIRFPIFQSSNLLIFFVGIVFTFLATVAESREIHVAAVVKPRYIQLGEKARLDLTISGETFIKHIEAPKFNFLPDFLAVPLDSETTPRLEADKIAVSMAWAYELIPQAVGDFALPDVRFAYQGGTYFANPGSVRVGHVDTYEDPSTGSIHKVETEVDTAEPFLNSPFTYTFRYLYTAVLPTRASPTPRLPEFRGFFVEKLQKAPIYTQQIRGRTFWIQAYTHKLYPKKSGQIVLAPAELLLPIPRGHKTLKTEPLTLEVQPIPETGRPPHFNGGIGEYQISAEIERGWVEIGNALTLTVRISGHGNIQTVTVPELPKIAGVMVSKPPNSTDDTSTTSRVYTYVLTPARTGAFRIPAIKYAYFNPNRAVYATTETLPIPVSVRPNPNDLVGSDDTGPPPWRLWLILFAILVLGLLVAGFLWYRAGFQRSTQASVNATTGTGTPDNGERKRPKSQRTDTEPVTPVSQARQALTALHQRGTEDAATAFANTLAQVLYEYLENTFGLTQRNIDTAREVCTQAGVSASLLDELVDLLTKCDYHRFAPVPLYAEERQALIGRAETVISDIAVGYHQPSAIST